MIYLQNITDPQAVFIPRSVDAPQGDLVFKAKSTIDLDVVTEQVVTDLHTSDRYYDIAVSLPEGIPTGEYEYTLEAGKDVLSTGILVVGETFRPNEYNKEITYEQYETE